LIHFYKRKCYKSILFEADPDLRVMLHGRGAPNP